MPLFRLVANDKGGAIAVKIWLYESIKSIRESLDRIEKVLYGIVQKEKHMSAELDLLKAEVQETQGAVDSAIALIVGLSDFIKLHSEDPAALLAMAAELDAKQAAIAAAVAANPVPVPPAPPVP